MLRKQRDGLQDGETEMKVLCSLSLWPRTMGLGATLW